MFPAKCARLFRGYIARLWLGISEAKTTSLGGLPHVATPIPPSDFVLLLYTRMHSRPMSVLPPLHGILDPRPTSPAAFFVSVRLLPPDFFHITHSLPRPRPPNPCLPGPHWPAQHQPKCSCSAAKTAIMPRSRISKVSPILAIRGSSGKCIGEGEFDSTMPSWNSSKMTHGGYSSKNGTAYVAKYIVASGVLLCIAVRHRGETFSLAEPLLLSTCSAIFYFFTRTNRFSWPWTDDIAENELWGRAIWRHGFTCFCLG